MRDIETSRPLPRTVVQQPDPMLDEQRPGPFRIGLTMLGAAVVVVLVMYGLSRPTEEPAQMANAPQASQSGGQAAAKAPQGQQQAGKANGAAQPSTTGQGQTPTENQQQQTQQGRGKSPRSDSATSGQASAPSDKAAPPKK